MDSGHNQMKNGSEDWWSGSSSAKTRARKLRKHASEMARAVQALLSLADEIELEEYTLEEKRRRKDAASGKDVSKNIFSTPNSESISVKEKSADADSNNSCKHQ